MNEELEKQIDRERQEIESAPKIPISQFAPKTTGTAGRCGFCGRIAAHLVEADRIGTGADMVIRYKGTECCGGRHQ